MPYRASMKMDRGSLPQGEARRVVSFFGRSISIISWYNDPDGEIARLRRYERGDPFVFARAGRLLAELLSSNKLVVLPGKLLVLIQHDRLRGPAVWASVNEEDGWTMRTILTAISEVAIDSCSYDQLQRFVVVGVIVEGQTAAPILFDKALPVKHRSGVLIPT